jgi:hypothetical protein
MISFKGKVNSKRNISIDELRIGAKQVGFDIVDQNANKLIVDLKNVMSWLYSGTWFLFAKSGGWSKLYLSTSELSVRYKITFNLTPSILITLFYLIIFEVGIFIFSNNPSSSMAYGAVFILLLFMILLSINAFIYYFSLIRKIKKIANN